ncbi:BadF/BadG/BcrA/BcrD ATPase family protein [Psychrobacillus sp. BM2]|uniref:BadF/BadG/BcrA/BcrD ATPase family protein n=1 Tax=Psychrobacillus sp. BM2 TaxID=3400421 RepID=UPI003B023144
MYVLGIDGGGTKTTAMVADKNGTVYMKAITRGSNLNTMTLKEFDIVISGLLLQLNVQNDEIYNQISICFAGMAGVGESGRDVEVASLLRKYLPKDIHIIIKNDALNALYAGTLGEAGIVQIAGTGSITFGVNDESKTVRSGGWGYLFDDEGSGFYLGNEALRAVFKEFDQRGPATLLTTAFLEYFEVNLVPDIIGKVYGSEHPRSIIAPLSQLVVDAAMANDEIAKSIITHACTEMMCSIQSCHDQLFERNHATNIVLSGGVFTNTNFFIDYFHQLAKEKLPNIRFKRALVSPVGGAVIAALLSKQVPINDRILKHLNEEISS